MRKMLGMPWQPTLELRLAQNFELFFTLRSRSHFEGIHGSHAIDLINLLWYLLWLWQLWVISCDFHSALDRPGNTWHWTDDAPFDFQWKTRARKHLASHSSHPSVQPRATMFNLPPKSVTFPPTLSFGPSLDTLQMLVESWLFQIIWSAFSVL